MRKENKEGNMTVAEAGRKGGEKTASTHGRQFYEKIGRKVGEKVSMERGPEFYSGIGSKGGSERARQHEGSAEAEGKISLEEAGHRGGQSPKTCPSRQKARRGITSKLFFVSFPIFNLDNGLFYGGETID